MAQNGVARSSNENMSGNSSQISDISNVNPASRIKNICQRYSNSEERCAQFILEKTDYITMPETNSASCISSNENNPNLNEKETNLNERSAEIPKKFKLTTSLKREKTHTDSLERKKKKVKFNTSDVLKDEKSTVPKMNNETYNIYDDLIRDADIISNTILARKLKKLLKTKSERYQCQVLKPDEEKLADETELINFKESNSELQDSGYGCSYDSEITFIDEDTDSQNDDEIKLKQNVKLIKSERSNSRSPSLKRQRALVNEDVDVPPSKSQKISDIKNDNILKNEKESSELNLRKINEEKLIRNEVINDQCPNVDKDGRYLEAALQKQLELKMNSTAAKKRAKVNVEKSLNLTDPHDKSEDIRENRYSGSFRDSAKKTLVNAWKSAMKSSNQIESTKTPKGDIDCCLLKMSDSSLGNFPSSNDCKEKESFETRVCDTTDNCKGKHFSSTKSNRLVGTVLPFAKDGGVKKKSKLQFDNEKAKLEAEIRKLNAENSRLHSELSEAKMYAENEESARKELKRENMRKIRQLKEEEKSKRELSIAELKNRLEEEHREQIAHLKSSLSKASESLFQKQEREHSEEMRKVKAESKMKVERVKTDFKMKYETQPPKAASIPKQISAKEVNIETQNLRISKKKLEESIQRLQDSEKEHILHLKKMQEDHQDSISSILRTSRQEHAKMVEELRQRERINSTLQKKVESLSTKLKNLVDKEEGDVARPKIFEKNEDCRKPLARSNSSPGRQILKPPSKIATRINSGARNSKNRQEHDCSHEVDMDSTSTSAGEVTRLKEEIEQHKRTIRQLSLKSLRDPREDGGPMSLGHMPSVSMDNVWPGSLYGRRQENPLQAQISELKEENRNLKSELQESRDQADLLEFRILELTEGSDRFSDSDEGSSIKELSSPSKVPQKEGSHASPTHEDLSLPLSIDSGLDLAQDSKKSKQSPQQSAASPAKVPILPSPPKDMEVCEQPKLHQMDESTLIDTKEEEQMKASDITDMAVRLQESLANSSINEDALLEAINTLRSLSSHLESLQGKVTGLSQENIYLQEALSALSEAHETRTEASGTESEIQNVRKTPTLHSDLSDSESDSSASGVEAHSHKKATATISTSSFQESGIFESSCDVSHMSTQTEVSEETPQEAGDLNSAMARLAAIKSVVQDGSVSVKIQESEEINRVTSEEEIHNKFSEVAELQAQLIAIRKEKEDLQIAFDVLQRSIDQETNRRCLESLEVDKGEARVLRQQLSVSEASRRSLYDEKCELEEAENDARLMVQRLDSQLTAAREMECLLSASLSQEQEISRELHRKVKELQAMEKERTLRQGILERQSLNSVERMANLVMDRDSYASLINFVKNGLIVAEVFRHLYANKPGTVVPYNPTVLVNNKEENYTHMVEYALDEALMDITDASINTANEIDFTNSFMLDSDDSNMINVDDFLVPGLREISIQTEPVVILEESGQTTTKEQHTTTTVIPNTTNNSNVTVIDIKTSQIMSEDIEMKPAIEMVSKSTMTVEKDLLSQRENYYLEQIETLQGEKINLRKDQEQERDESLSLCKSLESEIESLRQELSDSESLRGVLICQLEDVRREGEDRRRELERRMEELRTDLVNNTKLHESEKKALKRDYDARVQEISEDRRRVSDRLRELEHHLSALKKELEVVGMAIVTDRATYDGQPSAVQSQPESSVRLSPVVDCGSELLDRIRRLVQSESTLRKQVSDLEKKESAYKMTITEADKIMQGHMSNYTSRIEELEAVNGELSQKIRVVEESESRIRGSLKNSSRSEQDQRVADLLQQLINTEKSELEYKSKLWSLEKSEKQLQIKLIEAEKNYQTLKAELRDQEDLVHKMSALQAENNSLSQDLFKTQECSRRITEVAQSELFLRGRVDELEQSEQSLKEMLEQTSSFSLTRERKLTDQVSSLEEEIVAFKSQLEESNMRESAARETEISLRKQLDSVRLRLQESQRDLQETSSETINCETQHRSEVTKLRTQLKVVNTQLTDLDSVNGTLRERLEASEQLRENLEEQLEERKRRHESDLLQLNLQVSQKESRVQEAEGQLCELTQLHAAQELDMLASSTLAPVLRSANNLMLKLQLCDSCSLEQSANMNEFKSTLGILTDVLNGSNQSDVDSDDDDSKESRSLQPLPSEPVDTSTDSPQAVSLPPTSEASSSRTSSPVPVPAPRKKRKHSQKETPLCKEFDYAANIRGSFRSNRKRGNNTTILEELESKVRELETLIVSKEEELRLADSEAGELSAKVEEKEREVGERENQVAELRRALEKLQEQLILSLEAHECTKVAMTTQRKCDVNAMGERITILTQQIDRLIERSSLKDHIIDTLVTQIRALIRSTGMGVIITQFRELGSRLELSKQRRLESGQELDVEEIPLDYDIENVCGMLNRPLENSMIGTAIYEALMEHLICPTCHSNSSHSLPLTPTSLGDESDERNTFNKSSTYVETSSQTTQTDVKSHFFSPNVNKRSFIPKLVKKKFVPVPNKESPLVEAVSLRLPYSSGLSRSSSTPVVPNKLHMRLSPPTVKALPDHKLRTSPSLGNLMKSSGRRSPVTHAPLTHSASKVVASTSAVRKDSFRHRKSRQANISDSRCVKRMLTRGVPLNSPVECFESPEIRKDDDVMSNATFDMNSHVEETNATIVLSHGEPPQTTSPAKKQKTNSLPKWRPAGTSSLPPPSLTTPPCNNPQYKGGCVPKPCDLKITRRVGVDGVVLAWSPLEHDCVAGFQVVVGGNVVQQVRSPHRTKALITGLNLTSPVNIGLISVGIDGKMSAPAVVTCDRSKVYKGTRRSAPPVSSILRKPALPSCI